ncbi:MAG: DUF357 domain-containing protein [Candidatus Anstonellales archaeon]
MNERQRALISLEKTKAFFEHNKLYMDQNIREKALHYIKDAEYFFKKGDYFSSFGASDYAYGLIEGNINKKRKWA